MLMAVENVNGDRPSTGFCNEPLIGFKYAGVFPVHWALVE